MSKNRNLEYGKQSLAKFRAEPAAERVRRIVSWLDYSNESANDEIESVAHAEHLYEAALASGWDVYTDNIPEEAWSFALAGKVEEAAREIDAWMEHDEGAHVHQRRFAKGPVAGCKHCEAFAKTLSDLEMSNLGSKVET